LVKGSFGFGSFTEYVIKIVTNLNSWQVNKRYRDFEKLNSNLSDKLSPLPKLPQKSFFNLRDTVILERKVALEGYLNQVMTKHNLITFPLIMEFIEMEKEMFMLLSKCPTQIERHSDKRLSPLIPKRKSSDDLVQVKKANSNDCKIDENFLYEFNNEKEKLDVINDFLKDLEKKEEDKCSFIHKFWTYLTKKWPSYSKEEIMKLYYGDGNSLKGLLFHCGKISENSLGSQSCLDLLNKLIRYEYNPDCEKFLGVLKMGRLESLKKIKLEFHLKSSKNSVKQNSINIIKEVLNKERGLDLHKILSDEIAENKFLNWTGFESAL
jgi:hypothetical protein